MHPTKLLHKFPCGREGLGSDFESHDCHSHHLGRSDAPAVGANVTVNDVHFRNVRATVGAGHQGGCFVCNPGPLACRGITFDSVNLQVDGSQSGAPCTFSNVFGTGTDVHPPSCVPPKSG
jgi:hypothetical protein